jgi:hypothetical protein
MMWKSESDLHLLRRLRKEFDEQMDEVIDSHYQKKFNPVLMEYRNELVNRGWTKEEIMDYMMAPAYREAFIDRQRQYKAMMLQL